MSTQPKQFYQSTKKDLYRIRDGHCLLLALSSDEFLNKIIWDEYSTGDQTIILGQ